MKPFWSVQLGAYKTKPGAEEAWGEILANPMAVELSEAEVHYIPTKPLKNGKRLEMEVKPGDIVIYSKYAGTEVEVQDEELLVLGANDILAVIT